METKKEITRPRPGSAPLPTTTPFPGLPAPLRAKRGVGGTPAPLPHSVPQPPQPASPRVSSATGVSPPPPRDRAEGEPRNPPAPAQPLPAAVAPQAGSGSGTGTGSITEASGSPCPAGADGPPCGLPDWGSRAALVPPSSGSVPPLSVNGAKPGRKAAAAAMLHLGRAGRGGRHPSSSRPESPQIEAVVMTVD